MGQLQELVKEKGFNLSPLQLNHFDTYFQTLVDWNEKINLTAITEHNEVFLKHFYDSLTPAFYYDFNKVDRMCDVGSGAGFPSIPLKILYPHLNITIVDSLKKRIGFLEALTKALELDNVTLKHDRAETFGQTDAFRENFDVVTARAVARMSVLTELCLPLVAESGYFIAMKGASAKEEVKEAETAIKTLGGGLERTEALLLPEEKSHRHLIFVKKVGQTPKKYPRKPGLPNKKPL